MKMSVVKERVLLLINSDVSPTELFAQPKFMGSRKKTGASDVYLVGCLLGTEVCRVVSSCLQTQLRQLGKSLRIQSKCPTYPERHKGRGE